MLGKIQIPQPELSVCLEVNAAHDGCWQPMERAMGIERAAERGQVADNTNSPSTTGLP
jgi:hypothetical protein